MNGINHHLKYTHSGLSKCEFDSRKWVLGMLYGPQHTQIHTKYMDESKGEGDIRGLWPQHTQIHTKYMDESKWEGDIRGLWPQHTQIHTKYMDESKWEGDIRGHPPQHTQIHTKYMDESGGRGRKWWRGGPQVHIAKYMDILKEKKE